MDKLRRAFRGLAADLWIVVLDVIAVNAAYFLALLIRFYVNYEFRPTVTYYVTDFLVFAPFYTVLCLVVFTLLRLYGGMWRYAGLNDLNRIIAASLMTCAIHVAGTMLFVRRMPITYYVIGAVLQFAALVLIRFGRRIATVERREISRRRLPYIGTMIIGVGETSRRVIRHLEDDESRIYRAVCIVDDKLTGAGKSMNGVPVLGGLAHLEEYIQQYRVQSVIIADPLLTAEQRAETRRIVEERKLEFHDYSGFVSNLGGHLSLTELLRVMNGPVEIEVEGRNERFTSGEEALTALTDKYQIRSIEGSVRIRLSRPAKLTVQEALMREYAAVMGEENFGEAGSR